jgi:integrase
VALSLRPASAGRPDGAPYSARGFSAMWQRLMTKHVAKGGEHFTFHDLRAKAASDKGSAEDAAALLGHASTDTTRRVYRRTLTRATPVE